jgi:hypothetical protein
MSIQYSDIHDHSEGKFYIIMLYNDANYFTYINYYIIYSRFI